MLADDESHRCLFRERRSAPRPFPCKSATARGRYPPVPTAAIIASGMIETRAENEGAAVRRFSRAHPAMPGEERRKWPGCVSIRIDRRIAPRAWATKQRFARRRSIGRFDGPGLRSEMVAIGFFRYAGARWRRAFPNVRSAPCVELTGPDTDAKPTAPRTPPFVFLAGLKNARIEPWPCPGRFPRATYGLRSFDPGPSRPRLTTFGSRHSTPRPPLAGCPVGRSGAGPCITRNGGP